MNDTKVVESNIGTSRDEQSRPLLIRGTFRQSLQVTQRITLLSSDLHKPLYSKGAVQNAGDRTPSMAFALWFYGFAENVSTFIFRIEITIEAAPSVLVAVLEGNRA